MGRFDIFIILVLYVTCNMPTATCPLQQAHGNMPTATCPLQHAHCNKPTATCVTAPAETTTTATAVKDLTQQNA